MPYSLLITLIFVGFAAAEAWLGRLLQPKHGTLRDTLIDIASGIGLPLLVVPTIFNLVPAALSWLWPSSAGALAQWPWWLMFGVLLLADDLTQYLYHRASHRYAWLFRLHRAHHSAGYMSVRITYRNNYLYYAMMPGLWLSAGLVHAGFGGVYGAYVVAKMLVVTGAHSSAPWDAWLRRQPWLAPWMAVVERIISTPQTHAAHHGRHATDPGTHYRGNYGNFLFLWDVLLGTAKLTAQRPGAYGLENVAPASWAEELWWPLFGRRR